MEPLLSISEVAAATGLRPSALRYYEDAGLIASAARVGGKRHYAPAVLRRLAFIALCQDTGFGIAEIRGFLRAHAGAPDAWRSFAGAKLAELDERIAKARRMRTLLAETMACGCAGPDDCAIIARAGHTRTAPPDAQAKSARARST